MKEGSERVPSFCLNLLSIRRFRLLDPEAIAVVTTVCRFILTFIPGRSAQCRLSRSLSASHRRLSGRGMNRERDPVIQIVENRHEALNGIAFRVPSQQARDFWLVQLNKLRELGLSLAPCSQCVANGANQLGLGQLNIRIGKAEIPKNVA